MIAFSKMELSQIEEVLAVEKTLYKDHWTHEHFQYELLENPYAHLYCLRDGDTLIGYVGYWITFELCQITTVSIALPYQGQGYGKTLLAFVEEQALAEGCDAMQLEVRVSNEKAQGLYRAFGFEKINIRRSYYADNHEDALVMAKGIGESIYEDIEDPSN